MKYSIIDIEKNIKDQKNGGIRCQHKILINNINVLLLTTILLKSMEFEFSNNILLKNNLKTNIFLVLV